jgi:hypothetical protein
MENHFNDACDTSRLWFRPRFKPVTYGNGRRTVRYKIEMNRGGGTVGLTDSCEAKTLLQAERAAEKQIARLKKSRLFVIPITANHISDGEARSCHACAIYHALTDQRDRLLAPIKGYDDRGFKVNPYGAWTDPEGIVLQSGYEEIARTPVNQLPQIITQCEGGYFKEGMTEWAMTWDDWAESRYMSLKEWREERSYSDGERPFKPSPATFVLNVDAFTAEHAD